MPEPLAILLITALISFAGSVQPGPVNLAVIQATLSGSLKQGIYVALSGTLPEVIYTMVALKGQSFLLQNQKFLDALQLAVVPFFLITGLCSFFLPAKSVNKARRVRISQEALGGFSKGMLNPQLLPFWLVVLVYLHSFFSLQSFTSKLAFVLGAALGAFAILLMFALLARRFQGRLAVLSGPVTTGKIIGVFFMAMAVYQSFIIFL